MGSRFRDVGIYLIVSHKGPSGELSLPRGSLTVKCTNRCEGWAAGDRLTSERLRPCAGLTPQAPGTGLGKLSLPRPPLYFPLLPLLKFVEWCACVCVCVCVCKMLNYIFS